MSDITVMIPIKDEIIHIERAVKSALRLTPNVFVVDSNSIDGSDELATQLGARVFQYHWTEDSNFSKKINWALNNLPFTTTWVIRLDADEYFLDDAVENLNDTLAQLPEDVTGATLLWRHYFCRRWLKHGGAYPSTNLRVYRLGHVEMENRWLDEHMNLKDGRSVDLPYNIADDSKISLMNWIYKHNNNFSNKEALELINLEIGLFDREETNLDKNAQRVRKKKIRYAKMPKYWRCFFYFIYRYFCKLGFLDGREGFLWNFFQAWWYKTLSDAKVDEIYAACGKDKRKITEFVKKNYHLDITQDNVAAKVHDNDN